MKRYGIVSDRELIVLAETGEEISYQRDGSHTAWQQVPLAAQEASPKISCSAVVTRWRENHLPRIRDLRRCSIGAMLTAFLHFAQQGLDLLELIAIAGPVSLAQQFLGA